MKDQTRVRIIFVLSVFFVLLSGVSAQVSRDLIISDHVPSELIYTGNTMRNPLHPPGAGNVDFFLRIDEEAVVEMGSLHYRFSSGNWSVDNLIFESVFGEDEYWSVILSVPDDSTVEYYFEISSTGWDTTYIYGTDFSSEITINELTAQDNAYSFYVGGTPTPTPLPTGSPTPTSIPT